MQLIYLSTRHSASLSAILLQDISNSNQYGNYINLLGYITILIGCVNIFRKITLLIDLLVRIPLDM